MKWNNGKAHKALNKEHERLLELGMTEEQAQAMYDYDLSVLNGNRREAIHTQKLDIQAFDDENSDDGQNPLLEKFADKLTVEIDRNDVNRYAWVDEIENERLGIALKSMPQDYIELLTEIVIEGKTQKEIAQERGVVKSAISNKMKRIEKIIRESFSDA